MPHFHVTTVYFTVIINILLEIITFTALLTVLEDCSFAKRHSDWLFWFYSLKAFCNKNVHPLTEFTVVSCGTWVVHYNKHTHPWKKMLLNSSTDTQLLCPRYVILTLHEGSILILSTVGELKEKISQILQICNQFFSTSRKRKPFWNYDLESYTIYSIIKMIGFPWKFR